MNLGAIKGRLAEARSALIFEYDYRRAFRVDPVIICSMGKVGSRAVHATLSGLGLPNPVFHTHYLSAVHVNEILEEARRAGWKGEGGRSMEEARRLNRLGALTWPERRWKVISMTREPVVRDVSDLFQNPYHFPQLAGLQGETLVAGILQQLRADLSAFDGTRDYAATWFDREIRDVLEIDVYQTPFDREAGFTIYHGPHADLLVLRQEDMARCASAAFERFMGLKDLEIVRFNEGMQKDYKEVYREVRGRFKLPGAVLERIYDTQYARCFYSAAEIETFKAHWSE